MSKYVFYIFLWLIPALLLSSCRKEVRPTSIEIKDPDRHYYPIKQGQQLDIMFTITNTGNTPLLITDIQPSCGCIIIDKSSHVIIPEHGTKQFRATYNSIKTSVWLLTVSGSTEIFSLREKQKSNSTSMLCRMQITPAITKNCSKTLMSKTES